MLFIFVLWLSWRILAAQPPPPSEEGGLLTRYCGSDIHQLCLNVGGPREIVECLESHKTELTSDCIGFIGNVERGACNDEAYRLCAKFDTSKDIIACLKDHEDEISQACKENLYSRDQTRDTRTKQMRLNQLHVTEFITVISIAYLLAQLILAGWALMKFRDLYVLYSNVDRTPRTAGMKSQSTAQERAPEPMQVSFMGLSYWIRQSRAWTKPFEVPSCVRVLHRVAGKFLPGQVSAIMGPSGSGKTTLLKLLAGRMYTGEFDGIRVINGQAVSPKDYDEGYVPQHDVLIGQLSVWHTMVYAAMLRMPTLLPHKVKIEKALRIMSEMGLSGVADSPVGGGGAAGIAAVSVKGISGGQRRRLSIAQELLGTPGAIFLDEPTSGLDSHTSLHLMATLHRLSRRQNTTIVLSIHQPRSEVFGMFDSLILLGQGGRMVYSGHSDNAMAMLASCPKVSLNSTRYDNPGDFIIDILGLDEGSEGEVICYENGPNDEEYSHFYSGPVPFENTSSRASTTDMRMCGHSKQPSAEERIDIDGEDSAWPLASQLQQDEENIASNIGYDTAHAAVSEEEESVLDEGLLSGLGTCLSVDDISNAFTSNPLPQTQHPTSNALSNNLTHVLADHFYHSLAYVSLMRDVEASIAHFDHMSRPKPASSSVNAVSSTTGGVQSALELMSRGRQMVSGGLMGLQQRSAYAALDVDEDRNESVLEMCDRRKGSIELPSPPSMHGQPEISPPAKTDRGITNQDDNEDHEYEEEQEEIVLNEAPLPTTSFRRRDASNVDVTNTPRLRGQTNSWFMLPPVLPDSFMGRGDTRRRGGWVDVAIHQLWVLYSRRLTTFHPRMSELLSFSAQNIGIAVVISLAFSYDVDTDLELPYQVFMLIFILSSYAMILQYLTMVPEYFVERPVISMECSSGIVSYGPYIISALLTELVFNGIIGVVYIMHPLNPTTANTTFAFVCLMVGTCAWQSTICICSVVSDSISVAYTVSFLILGAGTLFGGLLVHLQDIPVMFRFVYYISVTAVTQRALIVNDLECCYLSVTCNSLANDFSHRRHSTTGMDFDYDWHGQSSQIHSEQYRPEGGPPGFCPNQLEFTGDGSDEGNLGRFALEVLNLENTTPINSLLFLFWANLVCRCVAILILTVRENLKYELTHVDEDEMILNEKNALGSANSTNLALNVSS